jgi:hypothetical protein
MLLCAVQFTHIGFLNKFGHVFESCERVQWEHLGVFSGQETAMWPYPWQLKHRVKLMKSSMRVVVHSMVTRLFAMSMFLVCGDTSMTQSMTPGFLSFFLNNGVNDDLNSLNAGNERLMLMFCE